MKKYLIAIFTIVISVFLTFSITGCNGNNETPSLGGYDNTVDGDAKAPIVAMQPKNIKVAQGKSVENLTVSAYVNDSGTISYQWYSSATDSTTNGEAINGGINSYLAIDSTTVGKVYYFCKVTNTNNSYKGKKVVDILSDVVSVEIFFRMDTPRLTKQPSSNNYVFGESSVARELAVTAVAEGSITYQWYKKSVEAGQDDVMIEGGTTSQYVPDIAQLGTFSYYCIVTSTIDSHVATITSEIAQISVGFDYGAYSFEQLTNDTCTLTAYTGASLTPYIPTVDVDGRTVVRIQSGVFASSLITEVTIPDTVVQIGTDFGTGWGNGDHTGAFNACESLTTINYNGDLIKVADFTFSNCRALETDIFARCSKVQQIGIGSFQAVPSLPANLVIPKTCSGKIGAVAFQHCKSIVSLTISGNSITEILDEAFAHCSNLVTVDLSSSITSFGSKPFASCSSLENFTARCEGASVKGLPFYDDIVAYPTINIFVPAESVETFKTKWGRFASKIQAIVIL